MEQTVTGSPYWSAINGIPTQYPYLSEDIDCDVVVVGAGVAGAMCAYSLACADVDTVLVDANIVGFGSTSVTSSILQYDMNFELYNLKDLIGLPNALRAYQACMRGIDKIENLSSVLSEDVGFSRKDSFYYTPDVKGADMIKQEYLLRRHNNLPVEFYDSVKAAEDFSFRVEAGIYSTNAAGEIDPFRLTHILISDAIDKGLRIYENTPIEVVTPQNDQVILETKTRHKIFAKKMVYATGYRAAKESGIAVTPVTSFSVVTKPVDDFNGWRNRCIIRDDGEPSVYMRTTQDNRILISGLDSYFVNGEGTVAGCIKLPGLADRKYEILEQKLISMFTEIDNIGAEYRFAGFSGETGDGLPYIGGRKNYPNIYFDICCGPNGIAFAALAADIIKELYLGGSPQDLDLFSLDR